MLRNELRPPITDPLYADSLVLRTCMESYDYLMSQPIVLGREASERFLDVMSKPRRKLAAPPIPFHDTEGP